MKKISNLNKAKEAESRLIDWINSSPDIPLSRGKPNKTEICRLLSITRSTVSSNQRLRKIFDDLQPKLTSSLRRSSRSKIMSEAEVQVLLDKITFLEGQVSLLRRENEELNTALGRSIHLKETGRKVW